MLFLWEWGVGGRMLRGTYCTQLACRSRKRSLASFCQTASLRIQNIHDHPVKSWALLAKIHMHGWMRVLHTGKIMPVRTAQ